MLVLSLTIAGAVSSLDDRPEGASGTPQRTEAIAGAADGWTGARAEASIGAPERRRGD